MPNVKVHINSVFDSATYIFEGTVVDPGDSQSFEGIMVRHILLSHCHFDHIYGLNALVESSPFAKVYTNSYGAEMLINAKLNLSKYHETPYVFKYPENIELVADGSNIDLGDGMIAKVYETPGHNPSCLTYVVDDALFTGDAYIPGFKTVTNLPHGNKVDAQKSIELIQRLAQHRTIYPGHSLPHNKG